jgi:hypothetical protein
MRDREHGEGEDRFERWEIESRERGAIENADLSLRLEENMLFILVFCFFWSASLVESGRFDLVQSVSNFGNRNRTQLEMFCDFLIG